MDLDRETNLVMDMVGASAFGDPQRAGELLERLAEGRPSGDMYPVCCAVAGAAKVLLEHMAAGVPGAAYWGLQIVGDGPVPPDVTFAQRFVVAYANGDTDMCLALYRAQEEQPGDVLPDAVCALVIYTGHLVRASWEARFGGFGHG